MIHDYQAWSPVGESHWPWPRLHPHLYGKLEGPVVFEGVHEEFQKGVSSLSRVTTVHSCGQSVYHLLPTELATQRLSACATDVGYPSLPRNLGLSERNVAPWGLCQTTMSASSWSMGLNDEGQHGLCNGALSSGSCSSLYDAQDIISTDTGAGSYGPICMVHWLQGQDNSRQSSQRGISQSGRCNRLSTSASTNAYSGIA